MTLAVTVWHISALLGKEAHHRKQAAQHSLLRTDLENFPIFHESSNPSPFGKLLSIQTHRKELPGNISAVQQEDALSSEVSTATALPPLNNSWAPGRPREVPQDCAVSLRKRLQFSLQDDSSLPPGSTWRFCHQALFLWAPERPW